MDGQKVENGIHTKGVADFRKKTAAKAAGLKSTFILDAAHGELLMTSFGKGNEANLEKRIYQNKITDLRSTKQFDVTQERKSDYILKNSRLKDLRIATDNPSHSREKENYLLPGMDQLRRKSVLEHRYFGKEFQDNIHIQLIYNILDITKVLAVYSSSVVYVLNNVCRLDNASGDLFSTLSTKIPFADYEKEKSGFSSFCRQKELKYFGTGFYHINPAKQRSSRDYCVPKSDEEIYNISALLGSLRQFCTHGAVQLQDKTSTPAWLYNLSSINADFLNTLNSTYASAIQSVNHNFAKTNKVNLNILMDALDIPDAELDEFARDYYTFIVLKPQKNLGFSLKKLRECMLELPQGKHLKNQKYDSVRHKMYTMLDYMLYYYYTHYAPNRLEELVEELRSLLVGGESEEKDNVYRREAVRLWPECENVICCIEERVAGKEIRNTQKHGEIFDEAVFEEIKLSPLTPDLDNVTSVQNAGYFCELMYLLTLFLDGKEINDLLTTLINKFDNIASFYNVLDGVHGERQFTKEYEMFSRSADISKTLRYINSFARMQKPLPNAGREMFRDAIQLLGTDMTDDEVESTIWDIFGYDENSGEKRKDVTHDIRNFISNNVIESDRFRYLIRYSDPRKVRKLAENEQIVRFVLSGTPGMPITGIPDSQLTRYCISCGRKDLTHRSEQIDYLTKLIVEMNYQQFAKVKNDDRKSSPDEKYKKQQFSAIISLYLTVLYLAVKNLVYINARYVMAFHCWERDCYLYGSEFTPDAAQKSEADIQKWTFNHVIKGKNRSPDYRKLTQYFIAQNYLKKRPRTYLTEDCAHVDDGIIHLYRNQVAHLAAVRDAHECAGDIDNLTSYFQLYHYIMQRALQKKIFADRVPETVAGYFTHLDKCHTCSKDFTKALNTPFGYNLARFKNLSVDELFDRNRSK